MGLFGKSKKKDPKKLVREWMATIRKEGRTLDRDIQGIEKEEDKVKISLRSAVKRQENNICTVFAKQLVESEKMKMKINKAKVHLKSVEYNLNNQIAAVRASGALEKSNEVMKSMSKLVKISSLSKTMKDMSKEMMKMGLIEESVEAEFDNLDVDDEFDEQAQRQVDKILWDITGGQMGRGPPAIADAFPVPIMTKAGKRSTVDKERPSSRLIAEALG